MQKSKIVTLLFAISIFIAEAKSVITLENLKVEYQAAPLGIDVEKPRFSWQMVSDHSKRGISQKAYQIEVSDESNSVVWNSEKTMGSESLNIYYSGLPLQPSTKYLWSIKVWDQDDNQYAADSWFETGLMNPDAHSSAWNGAQWIGSNDLVLYAHYLPVFKIKYSLKLDQATKTNKAGFIYGANDLRLMDKNKNLYHIESKKDNSYFLLELDISNAKPGKNAMLNVYRVGYHPDDKKNVPYQKYAIPENLINKDNKYDSHTICFSSVFGYTRIYLNDFKPENQIAEVNLNPLGAGGDFIAFPVIGDIGFYVPSKMSAYFSDVEISNFRSPSNILFSEKLDKNTYSGAFSKLLNNQLSIDHGSYKISGEKNGLFLTANIDKNSAPMLRTTFETGSQQIKKARLYVSSRGIYEVYINGNRIGNDYFDPGSSQYNKTHFYQTYDVTSQISSGKNAIGAILSEGWWSGGITYSGESWNLFGDRQSLLAKLVVTYSDGSEDIITTNPESWNYYNNGPIVYGSFFQGEVYDARKESEISGWSLSGYNDKNWKKASVISLDGTISRDTMNRRLCMPDVDDYSRMQLIGNIGPCPQKIKEITAISVNEIRPGIYIYDMGQNMVGVPKIALSGNEPGKKIIVRFSEVLYPDLPEYKGNVGMLMLENIRAAMAQDIYITKGGEETMNPSFTFHGYRFLEISGLQEPLPLDAVKGEVISSVHELTSAYETSNTKVNKLWENITWSTFGNFLSIPTDCPQRNERLGWSGDISVFSRTATFMTDAPQFLRRHMIAMRDVQRSDGRFPDIAPLGGGFGGILWGSAGITVPWESYQQYADKDMLAEHYDAMKSYIEFLQKQINPQTGILAEGKPEDWGNLGDWLSPEDNKNDKSLLWEAYFIYDLEIMQKIALALGKNEDAEKFDKLCKERKEFFNKTYIDPQTGQTIHSGFIASKKNELIDTQVSYVLPLIFNILDKEKEEKVIRNLIMTITGVDRIEFPPYSLLTGFIGTAWINKALSQHQQTDMAYSLFQQTSYPSWLYSVEQGATTIWERLNSYTHTNGFGGNNRMNSFNHYSFGAIGAWICNHSLGIERDENSPGFKHFILQPEYDPTKQMTYAKGHYDSMYGRIESSWKLSDKDCHYELTVPANTSATLYIQSSSPDNITEDGIPLSKVEGVNYVGNENGKCIFKLQSGKYNIKGN